MNVYERANLAVDHQALAEFYRSEVTKYDQVYQGSGGYFGGWALQSGNGSYQDGWQRGRQAYAGSTAAGVVTVNEEKFREIWKGQDPTSFTTRTELYQGPFGDLLDSLIERFMPLGVVPYRARISKLDAQHRLTFHRDSDQESWRLHVPVITNPGCVFEWDVAGDGNLVSVHMPVGTAWFVRVDQLHRFSNNGDEDRIHIMISLRGMSARKIERFNAV